MDFGKVVQLPDWSCVAVPSPVMGDDRIDWTGAMRVEAADWRCGFCSKEVGSHIGYAGRTRADAPPVAFVRICPRCSLPSLFLAGDELVPCALLGDPTPHAPPDITALYEEARRAAAARSYTGAVLLCRKILLHIGAELGAPEGSSFAQALVYLAGIGYVPPNGRGWVDRIRTRGNEATHEIVVMTRGDAEGLLLFVWSLLHFVYTMPAKLDPKA